ncbi:MAG: hypothetical protein GF364_07580 [Candidatus Lokiarchaeota archaeon]|nr:hypothetical protein [Candidatus Lokiarchaeota archaeon]
MSESNESTTKKSKKKKKKRRRGFAGIIWNQLKILNESEYFKENYGDQTFNVLLISTDDRHAAFVKLKEGTIDVDDIKYDKKDPQAIQDLIQTKDHDGLLKTDLETFFKLAQGKISTFGLLKMVITRNIRGVSTMLVFSKFFSVAAHEVKNQSQNKDK